MENNINLTYLTDFIELLNAINNEFLIIKRICYKMKNPLRRQKNYQYLTELKRSISKHIFKNFPVDYNKNQECI